MTSNLLSKSLTLTSLVATLVSVNVQGQEETNFITGIDRPSEGEYCDGFAITPNSGWQYCEFDFANDSDTFTVEGKGCFRATDYFVAGDEFTVVNSANNMAGNGGFLAGTPLPPSDPWGDAGWVSADYFSARAGLSGSNNPYSIAVTSTVNVGVPAGYYVRFDTGDVCNPLKAEDLASSNAIIVTNTGRESEDVFFPNGKIAARSVAPGVTVVMPAK